MPGARNSAASLSATVKIARDRARLCVWLFAIPIFFGIDLCSAEPTRGDLLSEPFTFVGVPKALSKKTFRDVDGLERGLLVQVKQVTAGRLESSQIEFPVPANQPSPLKIGVKYSITAAYGRHGLVILESHEIR